MVDNKFDFFGYGQISNLTNTSEAIKPIDSIAAMILFRLSGDTESLCTVVFETLPWLKDGSIDERESMSVEIANILISKIANQMIKETGEFIRISPPELIQIEEKNYKNIFASVRNSLQTAQQAEGYSLNNYVFESEGKETKICAVLMQSKHGNA